MFGYLVINKPEMKFREFELYQSYYCGLCHVLKQKYGSLGQATLTYDLTFVVLLLSGLYEPDTVTGEVRCLAHPVRRHRIRTNQFTDYAADMNLLFSYYKCQDDWSDDHNYRKYLLGKMLRSRSLAASGRCPEQAKAIAQYLAELSEREKEGCQDIDVMAGLFGKVMARLLLWKQDEWADCLSGLGFYLGKFIYLMDAYEDIEHDLKSGNYNPFASLYHDPGFQEKARSILTMMMAECSRNFEQLPIVEHAGILRNILYSGVWTRYESALTKNKERNRDE